MCLKVYDCFVVESSVLLVKQDYSSPSERSLWLQHELNVLTRSMYCSICKCWFLLFTWVNIPYFILKQRDSLYNLYLSFLSVQPLSYLTMFRIFCTLILLSVSKGKMVNYQWSQVNKTDGNFSNGCRKKCLILLQSAFSQAILQGVYVEIIRTPVNVTSKEI